MISNGTTSVLSMLTLEKVQKRTQTKMTAEVKVMRNEQGRIKIVIHRNVAKLIPIEDGDRVDVYFDKTNKMLVVDLNVDEGSFVTKYNAAGHTVFAFNGSDIPTTVVPVSEPRQFDVYRLVERGATELVVKSPESDASSKRAPRQEGTRPTSAPSISGKKRGRPRKNADAERDA